MTELMIAVATLSALVTALTEIIKNTVGTRGTATLVVAVVIGGILGALLVVGGISELHALTQLPAWLSGATVGMLAGLFAAGGRDALLNYQAKH